jgi:signal transduction histidine kinase
LASLAVPEARVGVGDFVVRLFARPGKQACEARLLRPGGVPFWAHLHGVAETVDGSVPRAARVAVSDITPIKEAEAARRRVEMLEMANQELRREIAQRQRAEADLMRIRERQAALLVEANRMQQQLRHLSRRILHAQEEERKRISRELHDQVTQTLVGVHVQLSALMRVAGVTPEEQGRRILRAQRLLEESVDLVHGFARELRPPVLDDIGLIEALRGFLGEFRERTGQRVGFSAFAGVDRVSNARRIVLFRVAQSALNNVAEHAHASVVRLRIRRVGDLIRMEVIDNGRSFDVAEVLHARKNFRLGLIGMRERVEMVGGEFSVVSVQGRGTTVRADVPMAAPGGSRAPD